MDPPEEVHAEEVYGYATVMSIGGVLAVSALATLAVSFYVSRRLQRSITEVASAATDVTHGNYEIRVSPPRPGDDFDALSTAFNQMASRLQAVESTRQRLFRDSSGRAIELQIRLMEEPYLIRAHGNVYRSYCQIVGRVLPH